LIENAVVAGCGESVEAEVPVFIPDLYNTMQGENQTSSQQGG
jgi:hypothetical protein